MLPDDVEATDFLFDGLTVSRIRGSGKPDQRPPAKGFSSE
jgi:hypothetical protein